jgi:hypothetical protein
MQRVRVDFVIFFLFSTTAPLLKCCARSLFLFSRLGVVSLISGRNSPKANACSASAAAN